MTSAATTATPAPATKDARGSGGAIERPTKRDEAWRYAPHRQLDRLKFGPPSEHAAGLPPEVEEQIPGINGPRIVIINGAVDRGSSNLDGLPAGADLVTLADAAGDDPELLGPDTAHGPSGRSDGFELLNASFGTDGAVLRVGAGVQVEEPLHIVHVVLPGSTQNASCSRAVLQLGAGSSATVVETRVGGGEDFVGSNTRTTIELDVDAALEHVVLQDAPPQQIHLATVAVTQSAGSVFTGRSFNLGALYGRIAYDVRLTGRGALAELSGLYFGFGDQVLDQQINVVHASADCTSRQFFRGVLDDGSTGVFNGGIDVRPGAEGTEAEQSNANLLLSRRAEANTQPRLEILADDVNCKHGATVGQLDESALYYLRSRGIDAEEARRMLIGGFADLLVDDVDIDGLRRWIRQRLRSRDG